MGYDTEEGMLLNERSLAKPVWQMLGSDEEIESEPRI
jgi:hypothetical protein